jgi:hypothetical protein
MNDKEMKLSIILFFIDQAHTKFNIDLDADGRTVRPMPLVIEPALNLVQPPLGIAGAREVCIDEIRVGTKRVLVRYVIDALGGGGAVQGLLQHLEPVLRDALEEERLLRRKDDGHPRASGDVTSGARQPAKSLFN